MVTLSQPEHVGMGMAEAVAQRLACYCSHGPLLVDCLQLVQSSMKEWPCLPAIVSQCSMGLIG